MKTFRVFLAESAASQIGGIRVVKVDKLRPGNDPEATYHNNTIELSPKFFKLSKKQREFVLFHELGHWFRDNFVKLADIMGWEDGDKFYNLFSAGNSEEGFADAFAVYCTSPTELERRYPTQHQLLASWVTMVDVAAAKRWVAEQVKSL